MNTCDDDHATESDIDEVISNTIASATLKRLKYKLVRWKQYLHDTAFFSKTKQLCSA
jgi:hypothetical protein